MDWIGVVAKKEREEEEEDGERGRGAVATLRKFEKALALLRSLSLSLPTDAVSLQPACCSNFLIDFFQHLRHIWPPSVAKLLNLHLPDI